MNTSAKETDVKSEIGIINFALQQLKIDPINSLDENSKESSVMKRNFQIAKEYVLSSFVYDWAHATTLLTAYPDFSGGYVEPSDAISIIGLGSSGQFCCCSNSFKNLNSYTHNFSVRKVNNRLYIESCCIDQYSTLHYIRNETNYDTMPADLFKLIGLELAMISSQALSKSENITAFLQQMITVTQRSVQSHEGMRYNQVKASPYSAYAYPFGNSSYLGWNDW